MAKRWKFAGISFDHMHMHDLLAQVDAHPRADIVGVCDPDPSRMEAASERFGILPEARFTDYRQCLAETQPDVVLLCPATATHGEWTERVAEYGVHILIEKPFAASLAEADRMIKAQRAQGKSLAINWPSRWYPVYITAKRLLDEGLIGELVEFHHYGGNRGPLCHRPGGAPSVEAPEDKARSWFYSRARGGGSLLDYAGYGATMGTWFMGGRRPIEVSAMTDEPAGLEVDEHSIIICRYAQGLSKIETRWGTFTDPWIHQPQPKCGFVLCGTRGTLSAYDHTGHVQIQTADRPEGYDQPVDAVLPPYQDPIQYLIHGLENGEDVSGPLDPDLARIGQQIVDTAQLSAREKRAVALLG